ncbi:TRAP transporter small permease subunit [Pokkaliibacter plantistimulans]|uniref:TRAP transporter small permease subunit n=1 Tax=Pokkaliibacter plantistimulans TaxID=1635171 RepID=UPI000D744E5C|nr:TRAP transporter small permease [Pokkaliibacter plantistimulans]
MGWLCRVQSVLDGFYRFCGALAALCLMGMAACVIISIIARILGSYIGGITEYSAYLMGAANCLGLAYTFRAGGHIRVSLVIERFGSQTQRWIELGCLAFGSAAALYLAWYLVNLSYMSWDFGEVSEGGDQMQLYIPQAVTAFGAAVLALSVVHSFFEHLCRLITGRFVGSQLTAAEAELRAHEKAIGG